MADDLMTDSEDELPHGWEERVSVDGKVFYACHSTEKTQWTHPSSGKRKRVTGELPYGWERKIGDTGYVYYIDHLNQKTTFTDPRLAFAIDDKDVAGDVTSLRQKYDGNTTASQVLAGRDLSRRYAIVTGANAGLGFQTTRSLALAGCTVVMACRDVDAAQTAANTIRKERAAADVHVMKIDLASLSSVRKFAKEYIGKDWPLHMLILNAGVFSPPYTLTEDGLELSFQVNYLSHHYLCRLLEQVLVRSAPSRIVNVSSESHRYRLPSILNSFDDMPASVASVDDITLEKLSPREADYSGLSQYSSTKLLMIAFSNAINERKVLHKVYSNSVHPGNVIPTSLSRHWWGYRVLFSTLRPFTKSAEQGAATTVFVATCKELDDVGGMYFNNCWVCEPSKLVQTREFCNKVYQLGESVLLDKLGPGAFEVEYPGQVDPPVFKTMSELPA